METVTRTGASVVGPVPLPTENVYCVIRSPHKYKDSREHFEMRTHKRLIVIFDPTPKTVDALMRIDLLYQRRREHSVGESAFIMARKGILGTKLGMTQVFDENNRVVPVTVVKAGSNVVTRIRPRSAMATAPSSSPTARSARARSPSRSPVSSPPPGSTRA